ncbi:hypothetical protein HDF18_12715 [Mucilaginibacter sp. X5P1]|uniref:hypothetical protein n=1 Tax=Mucilaginibacter sp. X5P1 TaxID=2723088 RepID=UPI001619F1A8|nr:hypothetical protein [Mucilaginibacter sp. X5P1]MBB6140313.1 hypothetical protein [Mucilaginibacter sp. X5P1]
MKKTLVIGVLLLLTVCANAQTIAVDGKKQIVNIELKKKLEKYAVYLRDFCKKYKIPNYVITVEYQHENDTDTYKVDAIIYQGFVTFFKPSSYAIVDSIPVLIHSQSQKSNKNNTELINWINNNYWKKEKKATKPKNSLISLPDSSMTYDEKGPKKVANSDLVPADMNWVGYCCEPKLIILIFKNDVFVSEHEGHGELRSQ